MNAPDYAPNLFGAQATLQGLLDRPLAFFDLETTGTGVNTDRIGELAYVTIFPAGERTSERMLFNPGIPIPPEATEIHGISDADVHDAPAFSDRAQVIVEAFNGCDLAGFNIRRFDVPLLLAEFKRVGVEFSLSGRRLIDCQTIFHRENPRDLTAAVKHYLSRDHQDAHSAGSDAEVCVDLLAAQLGAHSEIPRDINGIHAYCDEVSPFETELERWFDMSGAAPVFRRGKYSGQSVAQVARVNPGYFEWMLRKADDIPQEVKDIAQNALMGTYR